MLTEIMSQYANFSSSGTQPVYGTHSSSASSFAHCYGQTTKNV